MTVSRPRGIARPCRAAGALAGIALTMTGCQFNGLNSMGLPGTRGHGAGSFSVTMNVPSAVGLPQNSPVKVRDVTVGSVSGIEAVQQADGSVYAVVRLSLDGDTRLPANAVATVAQTTLLGSQHVELEAPHDAVPVGRLADGDVVPSSGPGHYATTEEVLSTVGLLVNNGNLGALQDVTNTLAQAMSSVTLTDLIPRLSQLTTSLAGQTGQIITLTEHLDRVAAALADHTNGLRQALTELPGALRVLNQQRGHIVEAFRTMNEFATSAAKILANIKSDFAADAKDLYPIIKALNDYRSELVSSMPMMPTFPFPAPAIPKAVRGDFLNSFATFDMTLRRLGENFFTTSPLDPNMKHMSQIVNPPDWLTGSMANLSGQAADPFTIPAGTASGSEGPH